MNEKYENDIAGQEVLLEIPHKHTLYLLCFFCFILEPNSCPFKIFSH